MLKIPLDDCKLCQYHIEALKSFVRCTKINDCIILVNSMPFYDIKNSKYIRLVYCNKERSAVQLTNMKEKLIESWNAYCLKNMNMDDDEDFASIV